MILTVTRLMYSAYRCVTNLCRFEGSGGGFLRANDREKHQVTITARSCEIDIWLLLDTNTTTHMGGSTVLFDHAR